jgi:hypothetical protein
MVLLQLVLLASAKQEPALVVRTATDFMGALRNKTRDVVVASHLDLTKIRTDSSELDGLRLQTRSIRVCDWVVFSCLIVMCCAS